jgi:predicted Zn-dependent protease
MLRPMPVRPIVLLVVFAQLVAACATNPVTGRREIMLMSEEQEVAKGRESAPQIAASMGLYEDADLQRYVESIGLPMAEASERPHLPWQFRVVDDPLVNAFAVLGGFLYVTRGILTHMNSEAELASVLGHEIGHVTARHSAAQYTKTVGVQLVLLPSAMLPRELQSVNQLLGSGLHVLLLKHGRDDERQSDELGLGYMTRAGYDPEEMVDVFRTLDRIGGKSDADGVPEWLSTHPKPANREQLIRARIARLPAAKRNGKIGRDAFLRQIDGIVYGHDPREGYFDAGNVFHHPALAFRMDFPPAWPTLNQRQLVGGMAPEQDALVQLILARESSPEEAAQSFLSAEGVRFTPPTRTRIGGQPAVTADFLTAGQQGPVRGVVAFVQHGSHVFRLMGYAPEQRFAQHEQALRGAVNSFARETNRAVLRVEPWRVGIVTPSERLSIEAFARRYPGPVSAEDLALMNGIEPGGSYTPGVPVKRVVGKPPP